MKKEDLAKEIEDVKGLLQNLEDEYRKANISEKDYEEAKKKYLSKLEELEKKSDKSGKGLFGLFKKKEEQKAEEQPKPQKEEPKQTEEREIEVGEVEEMTPEVIEKLAQQVAATAGVTPSETTEVAEEEPSASRDIEIEKLKAMIDSFRDMHRTTEESIRTLSESIGELRSMVFQVDGALRELSSKLEKIEDEVAGIKPKEIDKKFRELSESLEKQQISIEKLERKSEDLATRINEVHTLLKEAGGVENLAALSRDVRKKIEEMKEALKYTERLAFRTEKIFLDLSKSLEEFAVYKVKVDTLDETVKDMLKSIDALNLKVENLPTKNDLDVLRADMFGLQKEIEEIKKVLPLLDAKLPETIINLRKERENILLFLESLEEQFKTKAIGRADYEDAKNKSMAKLRNIEKGLVDEWKRLLAFLSPGAEAAPASEEVIAEGAETVGKEATEVQPAEKKPKKVKKKEKQKVETQTVEQQKEKVESSNEGSAEKKTEETMQEVEESKEEEKKSREEMITILKKIKEKVG